MPSLRMSYLPSLTEASFIASRRATKKAPAEMATMTTRDTIVRVLLDKIGPPEGRCAPTGKASIGGQTSQSIAAVTECPVDVSSSHAGTRRPARPRIHLFPPLWLCDAPPGRLRSRGDPPPPI